MAKFQSLVDITLILFYSCLLTIMAISTSAFIKPDTCEKNNMELKFVSVVFRHGDRTPEKSKGEYYLNNPHKNYSFPDGQLTDIGKKRAYELGVKLKERYECFLDNEYSPLNVYARSTCMTRTKMTLQLVLAGLYSVENSNLFATDIKYVELYKDNLMLPIICSTYVEIYNKLKQSPEVKKQIGEFHDLMKIMSKYTGNNITNINDLAILYSIFYAESHMKLYLPKWTQDIFPNGKLLDATLLSLKLRSYGELNYLNGGVLLHKIISDMNEKINGTLDRKINLFSGHDINVVALLMALNISVDYYPAYTSSVIIELYKQKKMYFIKVLYYQGIPSNIQEISIPGCKELCPYNKFIELMKSIKIFKQPCNPVNVKKESCDITIYDWK